MVKASPGNHGIKVFGFSLPCASCGNEELEPLIKSEK